MAVVDAPELPPLLFNRNGKYTYVCSYENAWDSERHMSVRVKGKTYTVGKIIGGELTGTIEWSEDFLNQYPILETLKTTRVVDKLKSKGKLTRYKLEFSQADDMDENSLFIRKATSLKVLHAGATWLLDQVVASTPLSKALCRAFDKYYGAKKLLSLAYFKTIETDKGMYLYEDFASCTRLPYHRPLGISSITRFLQHIDQDRIDVFLKKLNECCIEQEDKNKENVYYALDSTSISTCSDNLDFAEWGHNKDGDQLKQINIVMLVNQQTGCPLYYRHYAGSTPDVSTFNHLLKEYARMGLNRKAIMVADKGYGSVKNIHKLYQDNQSFILNMKLNFSICKNLIAKNLSYLLDDCSYNRKLGQNVLTEEIDWSYPGNFNKDSARCKREKGRMFIHIYLDHEIRNDAEDKFRARVAELLDKQKTETETLTQEEKDFLSTYVTEDSNGRKVINNTQKFEYMLCKGIRVLLSDFISDPVEASRAYTERNEVEESFRKLKDFTGARRLHISSSKTLSGKIFVHFLACSILCMLRHRIHTAEAKGIKLPFDSVPKMLASLSNITQTIFPDGGYFSEIVGKKKELREGLEIPFPETEMDIEYEEDIAAEAEENLD